LSDRENTNFSIISFITVYVAKFTKFSTLVKHLGLCLPWTFDSITAEKFERIAKTWNFHTCTFKSGY